MGDTAFQKVASLSGGERCRAALARLAAPTPISWCSTSRPTTSTSGPGTPWSRPLTAFDGTVLFVSHDRYFVNRSPITFSWSSRADSGWSRGTTRRISSRRRRTGQRDGPNRPPAERQEPPTAAAGRSQAGSPAERRFPYRKVQDLEADIRRRTNRGSRSCTPPGPAGNPPRRRPGPPDQGRARRNPAGPGDALRPLGRGRGVELVTKPFSPAARRRRG